MNEKESIGIVDVYKEIVNTLNQKGNLNRYEYYILGGVNFRNALHIIYILFRRKQITIQEYETLRNYIGRQLQLDNISRDKEFILRTLYQFGDIIITMEEKEYIWNNLCNLIDEANIDDLVFSGAVRAYALEKGLIKNNPKRLVKKK